MTHIKEFKILHMYHPDALRADFMGVSCSVKFRPMLLVIIAKRKL